MKVRSRERQILPPVSVQAQVEAPVLSAPAPLQRLENPQDAAGNH